MALNSASDCWAVGYYVNSGGPNASYRTLSEHWNGTSWSLGGGGSPNVSGAQGDFLQSVTCASVSDCWAVGDALYGSGPGARHLTLILLYFCGVAPARLVRLDPARRSHPVPPGGRMSL